MKRCSVAPDSLTNAVQDLAEQKAEHRDLVRQIAADPGMSPLLRETLLAHIYEEETEKVEALRGLLESTPTPAQSPARPAGLTVGSLRAQPADGGDPLRVGSLRP
ncbi:MAG: hypothetical protein KDD82_27510 [Planctomycetes bacterium]|nr:hypothetical protein [Planctomycetota bacterium]